MKVFYARRLARRAADAVHAVAEAVKKAKDSAERLPLRNFDLNWQN